MNARLASESADKGTADPSRQRPERGSVVRKSARALQLELEERLAGRANSADEELMSPADRSRILNQDLANSTVRLRS